MYRCRLTYDEWKCITAKRRIGKTLNTEEFVGYVGILSINEVSEPQIWKYNGEDLIVCDNNFDEQGYDEDGVPYFYDLYLDLVVYPDGTVIEDDMDELQEAL